MEDYKAVDDKGKEYDCAIFRVIGLAFLFGGAFSAFGWAAVFMCMGLVFLGVANDLQK